MFRFRQAFAAVTISIITTLALLASGSSANAAAPEAFDLATIDMPSVATASTMTYSVRWGDSLFGIAARYRVKVGDLLAVNKRVITSVIHPGDTLVLPVGAVEPAPKTPAAKTPALATPTPTTTTTPAPAAGATTTGNTTYVVQSGDYLISIAVKHGVKLAALLTANNITITTAIFPGSKLVIPPPTMPIPAPPAPPTQVSQTPTTTTVPSAPTTTAPATTSPTATVPPAPSTPLTPEQQQKIATVLTYLQAQIGKPYQFNAAGPDSFDCSGLVLAAYAQIGVSLPHQSSMQSKYGTAVEWKTQAILPGDLIFTASTSNPGVISHVGVAIDAKTWIQAARTGMPVRIGNLPLPERIEAVRRLVVG